MSILLTGGAGYIGSHTAVAMTEAGYDVIIADSLQNSHPAVIDRVGEITGRKPLFYKADVGYADGRSGAEVFNLGTGEPYSVLEIIAAFEKAAGVRVPYEIGPRRDGDLPEFWADPSKAERILKWKASRSLEEMCRDSWNWQRKNPDGYRGGEEDPE